MNLETVIEQQQVWRAGDLPEASVESIPTGYTVLDKLLAGHGLPMGALTEIMTERDGSSALQLLTPALAQLSQQGRWIALIAPPHVPYAPALAAAGVDISKVLLVHADDGNQLWATEQALRAGTCGAVLAWPKVVNDRQLRRLQLAAEEGHAMGLIFQTAATNRNQSSPAALRLQLENRPGGIDVHVLKRRGGWPTGPVHLEWNHESTVAMSSPAASATRRFYAN